MADIYRLKKGFGVHYMRDDNGNEYPVYAGETVSINDGSELGGGIYKFELIKIESSEESPQQPDDGADVVWVSKHVGAGRYDVINEATGKPINTVRLSKEEAKNLCETLSGSEGEEV